MTPPSDSSRTEATTGPSEPPGNRSLPRVVLAVCTFQRNEALRRLLIALDLAAATARDVCQVGVVVVDDNPDRRAESVVDDFQGVFPLGAHYRTAGQQNISVARNIGLEAAIPLADWIVMTDDDCAPGVDWLYELLAMQQRTGAEVVSGQLVRRAPDGSPRWIVDQPFLELGLAWHDDGSDVEIASTHNSMISSTSLSDVPDLRFDPALGRVGGEDMVFFNRARHEGLRIVYARRAKVFEDQPPQRLRYSFFLFQALWLGNSSYVTSVSTGAAGRSRMAVYGVGQLGRSVTRPCMRILQRQRPQWRYALALTAGGVGTLLGVCGVRINHH